MCSSPLRKSKIKIWQRLILCACVPGIFMCARVTTDSATWKSNTVALKANSAGIPKSAVRKMGPKDVPLLYWTAVSWGAAISISKDDPEMIADQPIVEALIDRALELDPDYDFGAIHNFLVTYESVRRTASGDFAPRSRKHFERAVELTSGQSASPYVALAETVSVSKQDHEEFESLLKSALAVNPDARPEWRLINIIMQRRARWLLSRENELFVK